MEKAICKLCKSEFLEATAEVNYGYCAKCHKGPFIKRAVNKIRESNESFSALAWIALLFLLTESYDFATIALILHIVLRK